MKVKQPSFSIAKLEKTLSTCTTETQKVLLIDVDQSTYVSHLVYG